MLVVGVAVVGRPAVVVRVVLVVGVLEVAVTMAEGVISRMPAVTSSTFGRRNIDGSLPSGVFPCSR